MFFCEDRGAALLVVRYTARGCKPIRLNISSILTRYPVCLWISWYVSSRDCELRSRPPVTLRYLRFCRCGYPYRNTPLLLTSTRRCFIVLPSFELRCCCQERGNDFDTMAAETLLDLVSVLHCIFPEQLHVFSRVTSCKCPFPYQARV